MKTSRALRIRMKKSPRRVVKAACAARNNFMQIEARRILFPEIFFSRHVHRFFVGLFLRESAISSLPFWLYSCQMKYCMRRIKFISKSVYLIMILLCRPCPKIITHCIPIIGTRIFQQIFTNKHAKLLSIHLRTKNALVI